MPLLAGDDLAGPERRRVERHLIGCLDCRSRADAARESLTLLHDFATLNPLDAGAKSAGKAPSLWPALARQIREAKRHPVRPSLGAWVRSWSLSPGPVWAGSGLVATLLLSLVWFGSASRPDVPTPPAPAVVVVEPVVADPVEPPAVVLDPTLAPLMADNERARQLFEEFNELVRRFKRRTAALPDTAAPTEMSLLKPAVDPFAAPLDLRLDYSLRWGTLVGPTADTQHAY